MVSTIAKSAASRAAPSSVSFDMLTHYTILGVTRAATKGEIRTAYIIKARAEHPDVGGEAEQFTLAAEAYKVLTNGQRRKEYDAWLDAVGVVCPTCKGRGVLFKQQTFKERTNARCNTCKGGGFTRRKGS